jgi:hypothetical protein
MKRLRRRSTSSRLTIAGCQFQGGEIPSSLIASPKTSKHTVGRGHNVIEQLGSADRASAALHIVHGSRVGLSGLVHFGGRGECEMAR